MALLLLGALCELPALSSPPPSQETPAVPFGCLENALLVKLSQAISLRCLSLLAALPSALTALIVVSFNPFVYPSDPLPSPCFSRISISGTRQTPVCQLSELVSLGSGFAVATLRAWSPGLRPLLTRPVYTAQLRSRGRYVGHRGTAWVLALAHPLVHCVLRTTLCESLCDCTSDCVVTSHGESCAGQLQDAGKPCVWEAVCCTGRWE